MPYSFLTQAGWGDAVRQTIGADYSTRIFSRLRKGDATAILMQGGRDQKTREFVIIDKLLCDCGLSAPEIYAADPDAGYVLMEDFGSGGTLGQALDRGAAQKPLYDKGIDVLAWLHETFSLSAAERQGLPVFSADLLTEQVCLFLDFYRPAYGGGAASQGERADFCGVFRKALDAVDASPRSLLLRDYMLDNLMDLPERSGPKATGILDFQDGGIGPIAYDIASLVEGVRRDTDRDLLDRIIDVYLSQRPVMERSEMKRLVLLLSLQRHVRILGIFARLEKKDIVTRVTTTVRRLLQDESLAPLRGVIRLAL